MVPAAQKGCWEHLTEKEHFNFIGVHIKNHCAFSVSYQLVRALPSAILTSDQLPDVFATFIHYYIHSQ